MGEKDERIVDLEDEAAILPALEGDRLWAAYAICDLEPPHRAYGRYIGRRRDGQTDAVVLVYAPPSFTSMVPCGSKDGIRQIFAEAGALPESSLFLARQDDLPALEIRYRLDRLCEMLRLAVQAGALRPVERVDAEVRRLDDADLEALETLYAIWPDSIFARSMFAEGIYFGAFRDSTLVAAAGTHAVSVRHGMAIIGNVFTQPAHRACGLGKATTGAVTQALIERGVRDVVLNVRADNIAAIATYERLGFANLQRFWEGRGTLR